jgi:hypothetical protein
MVDWVMANSGGRSWQGKATTLRLGVKRAVHLGNVAACQAGLSSLNPAACPSRARMGAAWGIV